MNLFDHMEDLKTLETKLTETEKELQDLRSKLEKVTDFMENASTPLHWVNYDGIIIWANFAELELLGYTEKEYIGKSIFEFHKDRQAISTLLSRLQRGEVIKNFPAQLISKNGSIKDVLINSSAYQKDGEFIHSRCFTRDITDFKKEEEHKAKKHSQELNHMFMQSPFALTILKGNDFVIELANDKALEIWDRTSEQVLNKKTFDVFPELIDQGYRGILESVYITGIPYIANEIPLQLFRKGKLADVFINFTYQPIFNTSGVVDRIMGIGFEVTAEITARRTIEESEIRSRLAIEAAEMGSFDWDLLNQVFYSSPRLIEIFGFSDPATAHQHLINTFHPDDKPIRDKAVADSFSKGSLVYEARVIWPDKSIHWIRVYGKITHDSQQQPQRMFGIVTDITEQKEAEFVLKEDARKIRAILESLPQMAWTAYPNGIVNYFSESWYSYTGLKPGTELMDVWSAVWHPDHTQKAKDAWAHSIKNHTPYEMENLARRASDGMYRWMWIKAIPLKNAEGDILLWVGSITDIHEQKTFAENLEQKINERTNQLKQSRFHLAELNNELAEKNFELQKQNSELTSFNYIASHDLQEPIRKIHTFSQLILEREKDSLTHTTRDYLNRISLSSVRMKQLVEAFLNYSRVGSASMVFEPTNLNTLFSEIVMTLSEVIQENKAIVEFKDLPVVQGDGIQLQQLFINLISNALKYSKPGVNPVITIRSEKIPGTADELPGGYESNDYFKISIADNGIGFDPQHASKIFEVFQRLHSKDEYAGTGIGLSICKKIILAHKGFISATGEPGVGSVFLVYLPTKM
jgi:PAS domain S-box-containing protein